MTSTASVKPKVLLVDDEPQVLQGLSLHLGRHYVVMTAGGGAAAPETLAREPDIAVVMSDMRMPGMDGATFLARARQLVPNTVRLLLTGQTDISSAVAAINEGQIFRFLTKPCPPPMLIAAVAAAAEQHQLVIAERVLLEQTLYGSIKAMTDVLALVSPTSFGRATRIKQLVSELAEQLALRERWQVEVAAMLSQLCFITLPAETAERVYYGRPLSAAEQVLVDRLPAVTEELLINIPRLEVVRDILKCIAKPYRPDAVAYADERKRIVATGAHLLRVTMDFDTLESNGASPALAIEALRTRVGQYDPGILQALSAVRSAAHTPDVRELPASELRVGMIISEDVKMPNGVLMVARGYEITERFLERLRNITAENAKQVSWRVKAPRQETE
ncbi:MAG: response regulator [Gemmatimonas sp.]